MSANGYPDAVEVLCIGPRYCAPPDHDFDCPAYSAKALACVDTALAAAYASGREKGLEEAALRLERSAEANNAEADKYDVPGGDHSKLLHWHTRAIALEHAADLVRALAAQPPPALAQPSATRKEE